MRRLLDLLACFWLDHDEAIHYAEDAHGETLYLGTYCLQCKLKIDYRKALGY